jgi:amino acid transporter
MTSRPVFLRDATGLVKQMSVWDAFWLNSMSSASGGLIAPLFIFAVGPIVFPGGDYLIACVGYLVVMSAQSLAYAFLTAAMPRSGGDYVFVSRTVHPVVGLFSNFNLTFWNFGFFAFVCFYVATYFSRLMGDFGASDPAAWALTPFGTFAIGTVVVVLCGLLVLRGVRNYFKFQNFVIIVSLIALVVVVGILWINAATFHQAFNQWANANNVASGPDPYQTVINTAASQGYVNPGFSVWATLGLIPIVYSIANYNNVSSYVSGEMKNAQSFKNQVYALVGSVVANTIMIGALVGMLIYTVGYNFLSSVVFSASSFPTIATTWDFFVRILTPQYMWFVDGSMVLICFTVTALELLFATRCIFAWSFDRLVPTKLSAVSDRFHSPINSVLVSMALAELLLGLMTFTGVIALYAASAFGTVVTFFIASVAVAIFPFWRKRIFEASVVKYRIAGIPAMTIAGLTSALCLVFVSYYFVAMPVLAGYSTITGYVIIGLVVAAALVYYGAKMYHQKKEGMDIGLAFAEIPPE